MAISTLAMAPRRPLASNAPLGRPPQQCLRRDADEGGGGARPIPLAWSGTRDTETETLTDSMQSMQ